MFLQKSNYLKDDKELMKEYDYDKNTEFDLNTLTLGSDRKVWWICSKGHNWQAGIGSRHRSCAGCPICANRLVLKGYNDLESQCPKVAKEWNYEKNDFSPDEIVYSSNKKVWWICEHGHEWETTIVNRTKEKGTNCPYCTNQKILAGYNDLATENPDLASEWNYEKNELNPNEIGSKSKKSVWWKCENGHEWQQVIEVRNRGIGCPYCNGKKITKGENDLLSKYPRIAKEWDYIKNDKKPDEVFPSSSKMFWWICPKGHSYKQTAGNRIQNHGCPICSKERVTSFQEKIVFYYVKKYFPSTIDNYKIKELGKREIDIFVPSINVGIEYDGGYYHIDPNNDLEKDKICDNLGIKLYRIRDNKCAKINSTSICYYRKNKSTEDLTKIIIELLNDLGVEKADIDIDRDLDSIYNEIEHATKKESLATKYPEIAKEWNYERNGNFKPEHIAPKSSKKVWWKCSKCGYEWLTNPNNRSRGQGCPQCYKERTKNE